MKNALIAIFTLILCFSINAAQATPEEKPVGTISQLQGTVYKLENDTLSKLQISTPVYMGTHLKTDPESIAQIDFIDGTSVTIGSDSNLIIDEYVYYGEENEKNKMELSFPKSVFHYKTGHIKNKESSNVKLNLDFGSIGIRGTQVWRDLITTNNQQGMKCRIYIEDGEVLVTNNAGSVGLKTGEGTSMTGTESQPAAARAWTQEEIEEIKAKTLIRFIPNNYK